MHEIDSDYEPTSSPEETAKFLGITVEDLREREIQRILSERKVKPELTEAERYEAALAAQLALGIARVVLKKDGASKRTRNRAIDYFLVEYDLGKLTPELGEYPVISLLEQADKEAKHAMTSIFTFYPDRVMEDLRFSRDGRLNYSKEVGYSELVSLASDLLSIPCIPQISASR